MINKIKMNAYNALPTAYTSALSYYETLCKAIKAVNECIDAVNALAPVDSAGYIDLVEQETAPENADIYKDTVSNIHVVNPLIAEFGVNASGMPITNVPEPTADDQAVNKKYVDDNAGGGGSSSPISLYTTVTFWETGSQVGTANITSAKLYPSANMLVIEGSGAYLASDNGVGDNYLTVECSDLVGQYGVITGVLQSGGSGNTASTIVGRASMEYWDPDGVTLYNLGTQTVGESGGNNPFVLTLFLVKL